MRAFPGPSRVLAATVSAGLVLSLAGFGSAQADNPSVSEIQVRLVETRQQLNDLYAQAAAAGEQANRAEYELRQARTALKAQRTEQRSAQKALDQQREVVAEMTVEQQQFGSTSQAMMSVLDGAEPSKVLEEVAGLNAVDEAMTAQLDQLDARQAVLDVKTRQVRGSVAAQERAAADRAAATERIADAIDRAEKLAASTEAERDRLIKQLARAKKVTVAEARQAQDKIDERLDASGPAAPPASDEPGTAPADPQPTSKPTTKPKPPADPGPPSGSKVETAIAYAKAQLGEPYKWGGAGPSSWDCSGLTMRAWQAAGVNLSHYAGSQYTATKKVSVKNIRRGDLLFWSNGSVGSIYHVALYLGDGQMIHAPRPGRGVEIVPLSYWIQPDLASRPG